MSVQPPSRSHRRRRACRADFVWFGVLFVGATLFLNVVVDCWPRFYDPEYGHRLGLLRQRIAEAPERPLLVFVGSSRVGDGFHPELMPEVRSPEGQPVLAFNLSHLAAGPVINLMMVQRLLREGIRPRWVVTELAPMILTGESVGMATTDSGAADLPTLFRYIDPGRVAMVYLRSRLNSWYKHRQTLLEAFAPALACPRDVHDQMRLNPQGGDNFWICPQSISAEEVRRRTTQTLNNDRARMQQYRVSPPADQALREFLALCRREGIGAAVVITPESSEYRGLYSADAERQVAEYAADLERSYGVRVVDARGWVPDDCFSDGHHMLRPGGVLFTRRLAAEVVEPLAAGRLRP